MVRFEAAAHGLQDCGQTVTIWNRYYDSESGKDVFVRHVIPVLCKWKSTEKRGESRIQANVAAASVSLSLTVIVPYTEEYRQYDAWKEMEKTAKRRYFTLHAGDLIALGKHTTEITGVPPFTETGVKKLIGDKCAVVSAFADNTGGNGARRGGHYKVGCLFGYKNQF